MTASLRVAVADDEPIMRMYLEDILPDWGYTVVSAAENGEELVAQCRAHHPDLVVTDIRMPMMDGIEAVERITRETSVPVVFISGFGDQERLKSLKGCVIGYLTKPVGEYELQAALEDVLDRFREQRGTDDHEEG